MGGGHRSAHAVATSDNSRTLNVPSAPSSPHARTARSPQLIALKDGEPIPAGYSYLVRERPNNGPPSTHQPQRQSDMVDLCTPPKDALDSPGDIAGNAKSASAARRNLTKNLNRKAHSAFARDMKDSLATGRPSTIRLPEDETTLKARWHAAAKEVAYKLLDLRKESWKDYNYFEKEVVHRELDEKYKFDPPIDPKKVDKYLSGHLRTSRAVWKAHWIKYGDAQKHHNCPADAWAKLIKWWSTDACHEESAEMAKRRSRVQTNRKTGRKSLLEKMDGAVSHI